MALVEYSLPHPGARPKLREDAPGPARALSERDAAAAASTASAATHQAAATAPQRREVAIDIDGLEVVLGRRAVVDRLTLRVHRGEVVAVLGRPGAGRSVLLRALAGLDYRAKGRMLVLPHAGYLPQDARMAAWRSVRATVARGGRRAGELDERKGATRSQVADALHRVGLDGDESRRVHRLSPGERRRIALARAIVGRPSVLLLDEPTRDLGTVAAAQVRGALHGAIAEDRPAVLLSTADVDEALLLADRIVVLERGRITADLAVELPSPRRRGEAGFGELRSSLLAALHVDERAEGHRH
jgi:sulfonate transport system ATP-binding protein